jgi:hypothetical protein
MKIDIKNEQFHWTRHVKKKMSYYNLSESRVKRVLRKPDRKEIGVAPLTVALMQRTGTKKHPTEIWAMYQKIVSKKKKMTKVISAWRYPGISPIREYNQIIKDFYILYQEDEFKEKAKKSSSI